MQRFIGIDVHQASSTVAVVSDKGKRLKCTVVETNAAALVGLLKQLPGEKHICIEEGLQAAWLYEVLLPHAEEVAVVNVRQRNQSKNDKLDAFGLADDFRLGKFKSHVFKERGRYGGLKAAASIYRKTVRDHVRVQNRLKSIFRARGIKVLDSSYGEAERKRLLAALPSYQRSAAAIVLEHLDAVSLVRSKVDDLLMVEAHKHRASKRLATVPGLGPKRVAQLMAVVVDPHRFGNKRVFWAYCGFAVQTHSSADWLQSEGRWVRAKTTMTRGLNRAHNTVLKDVFKGAAQTVVWAGNEDNPLFQVYQRLLTQGTRPPLAMLTIARKIAAIALAVWKKGEDYSTTQVTLDS